jgi:FtsP/CotA-like multicopper oxidase with cupredoxin domain
LIRARAGTNVALSLRNTLAADLQVFGLCSKPGPCDPMTIAAGATREIRFSLDAPGTYHYWASQSSQTLQRRPRVDSQLGGAIVADPPSGAVDDRIMIVTIAADADACIALSANDVFAINGRSWPHTSRLHYKVGEDVRWRVINLSCDAHAMHLHGFHFAMTGIGDGLVDESLSGDDVRTEVTEMIVPGRTMSLTWTPTRPGNWLFHCHMVGHMMRKGTDPHAGHDGVDDDAGMAGLVVGVEVTGSPAPSPGTTVPTRKLTMVLREETERYGKGFPGFRIDFEGTDAPRLNTGPAPGPVLILRRGEPTEITVVNRTSGPTAIHWHGMEIESYFDGVPGFGGAAGSLAPAIAPGDSFVVKMTPPRAGTFMYHTHWHDETQLAGGMYGPLLVLEPGERYDPDVDHIVMIGFAGAYTHGGHRPYALNGQTAPEPIQMRAGVPNRLRLINITPNNVGLTASLVSTFDTTQWKLVAKDGAEITGEQSLLRVARQLVSVGETYDIEFTPPPAQTLWFDFSSRFGQWVLQARVQVR